MVMLKCTLNYENLPEKRSTRTGLADVGDGKKKTSLLWLFRQNFDIIDGRKIFIKLSMIK